VKECICKSTGVNDSASFSAFGSVKGFTFICCGLYLNEIDEYPTGREL